MKQNHPITIRPVLLAAVLCLFAASGCRSSAPVQSTLPTGETRIVSESTLSARLLPVDDQRLLIIGQDLSSIADYVDSGYFETPGGVTTYLAFYNLLSSRHPVYGALGEQADGTPIGYDVDWGAGRLNANSAALAYPQSSLVIGLSLAEGSGDTIWADGALQAIGRGEHDDKIARLAEFLNAIDKPVYLRVGYEFDGAWNRGYDDTAAYIAAFRRIVDGLRSAGVRQVAYVWQASASPVDDVIDGRQESIEDWYPGDEYVDWLGLSWFLHADESAGSGRSQRQLADEVLALARSRNKPVMIAEAAPQGYDLTRLRRAHSSPLRDGAPGTASTPIDADAIWQAWYEPLFDYLDDNRDVLRALAYINANWDAQSMWSAPYDSGYWGDSRLQANDLIAERWRQRVGANSGWLHGSEALPSQLMD